MTSRSLFFGRMLTRALFSERAVVNFFHSTLDAAYYVYTVTIGTETLCTVSHVVDSGWTVKADEKVTVYRTVEEAAAFVKTLPGFKLSTHEKRIAGMVAPKVGGVNRGGTFLSTSPTVGTRWITRTECDGVIIPKLDKWLAVHETKTKATV